MKLAWLFALGGVSAAALAACREDPEHPPYAAPCPPGERCVDPPAGGPGPGRGGSGAVGGGAAGEPAEAGAGGAPSTSTPTELFGTVRELVDDRFRSSIAFASRATVEVEGEHGGLVRATYDGASTFRLEGFRAEDPLWVGVSPEPNRGVLSTLHPILLDSIDSEPLELGVVRGDTLFSIFALSLDPEGPLPDHAQVVLLFTNGAGQGRSGVRVTLPEADFVSYQRGSAWSSAETETDATGLVLLANVAAPRFPGSTESIQLGGSASGYIRVRVAADAVSLVEVPVQ